MDKRTSLKIGIVTVSSMKRRRFKDKNCKDRRRKYGMMKRTSLVMTKKNHKVPNQRQKMILRRKTNLR